MAAALRRVSGAAVTACRKAAEQPPRATIATQVRPAAPPPPPPFAAADAAEALAMLRHASEQGFSALRFRTADIEQALGAADTAKRAEGQRRLRAAVLDYARAQHGLTIPLAALPKAWNQRPSRYDAGAELDGALRAGTMQAWLDGLPPQTPEYRALQAAYVAAIGDHGDHIRPRVAVGPLDLGEQDAARARCATGWRSRLLNLTTWTPMRRWTRISSTPCGPTRRVTDWKRRARSTRRRWRG